MTWENRIVATDNVDPRTLIPHPENWRKHPVVQRQSLERAIGKLGWVQMVTVNRVTGRIIDGHLRALAASENGEPTVPVAYVELTENEEREALLTLDPIAAMADADNELLARLIAESAFDDEAILRQFTESYDLGKVPRVGLTDPDAVPEPPAEPITRLGDLWLLGEHRVLCGDATVDIPQLMDDERAELVWTDPPYGVGIGEKNRYLNSIAPSNRIEEDLENDTLDEQALTTLICAAFSLTAKYCTAGAAWYIAAPAGPLHLRFGEVLRELGIYRQTLIWAKNNATFAPLGVSYHWAHEPIFYGWMPDGAHRYHGDRKQTTLWEIQRPKASPDHPTTKPIELVTRAVEHSSLPGQVVLDPFLGSGTTVIACEQLGRRCYGLEIEPRYVDVTVRRWEQFTGLTAQRVVS